MAKIETGTLDELIDPVDVTTLINDFTPKSWKCPHCGKRNITGKYAEMILLENLKYLEHCDTCGNVHCWQLELTEEFKKKVVDMLMKGGSR